MVILNFHYLPPNLINAVVGFGEYYIPNLELADNLGKGLFPDKGNISEGRGRRSYNFCYILHEDMESSLHDKNYYVNYVKT